MGIDILEKRLDGVPKFPLDVLESFLRMLSPFITLNININKHNII